MTKICLTLILLMTLSACSTVSHEKPISAPFNAALQKIPCYPAFKALDQLAFHRAGTLLGNRIPQMPWLRHDRLITNEISTLSSSTGVSKLLQKMSSLAIQGLSYELAAIPNLTLQHWEVRYRTKLSSNDFVKQCIEQLIQHQHAAPQKTLEDLKAIPEDNDYSTFARVAGLYPLAAIPFRLGVVKEQRQLAKEWGKITGKRWLKYPPKLSSSSEGVPRQWELLKQHAPTWLINSRTPPNIPGAPYWQGKQLKVNVQDVTTYSFISHARWKQQPITQLNYIIWFTERPRIKKLDLVAGQHDAVVFRVNLDPRGKVIAYDSIHLCGCWYRLFLPAGRPFKPSSRYWQEPVLMQRVDSPPRLMPRMAVYLQADTHQIQYLEPAAKLSKGSQERTINKHYQLQPFSRLLTLSSDTGVRPVFNTKGYVAGSERPERWVFWPMGVKNPGALRRFGDHAISFVGRRYFDDPHLLEKVSGLMLEN